MQFDNVFVFSVVNFGNFPTSICIFREESARWYCMQTKALSYKASLTQVHMAPFLKVCPIKDFAPNGGAISGGSAATRSWRYFSDRH